VKPNESGKLTYNPSQQSYEEKRKGRDEEGHRLPPVPTLALGLPGRSPISWIFIVQVPPSEAQPTINRDKSSPNACSQPITKVYLHIDGTRRLQEYEDQRQSILPALYGIVRLGNGHLTAPSLMQPLKPPSCLLDMGRSGYPNKDKDNAEHCKLHAFFGFWVVLPH